MKFWLLVALLLPATAHAADRTELCDYYTRHVPTADTTYQPGVDTNGLAVAPADLPGSGSIKIPDRIAIYITPDLFKFLNVPGNPSYIPNADIGVVEADQNGGLFFNGQPISQEAQSNLVAHCQKTSTATIKPKKDLLKGK